MGKAAVGVQKSSSFVGLATPLELFVTLFCVGMNAEKSGVPSGLSLFSGRSHIAVLCHGGEVAAPQVGNGFICSVSLRGSCLS